MTEATRGGERTKRSRAVHRWARLVHVYSSMIALFVVLFFSITGLTLNHPTWTLGGEARRSTVHGTLPDGWKVGETVDWLVVSEFLRTTHHVRGDVTNRTADAVQASITYKGPGYGADAFINPDGSYEMTVDAQGFLGIMNDLHKGRDSRGSWRWLIDLSAVVLCVISLTGLAMQFFLRRRRRSAFLAVAVGTLITTAMVWLATR